MDVFAVMDPLPGRLCRCVNSNNVATGDERR